MFTQSAWIIVHALYRCMYHTASEGGGFLSSSICLILSFILQSSHTHTLTHKPACGLALTLKFCWIAFKGRQCCHGSRQVAHIRLLSVFEKVCACLCVCVYAA